MQQPRELMTQRMLTLVHPAGKVSRSELEIFTLSFDQRQSASPGPRRGTD